MTPQSPPKWALGRAQHAVNQLRSMILASHPTESQDAYFAHALAHVREEALKEAAKLCRTGVERGQFLEEVEHKIIALKERAP